MNKYKKITVVTLVLLCVAFSVNASDKREVAATFAKWPLGTSTSVFSDRINKETFSEIKAAGISYIEVNLNPLRGKDIEFQKNWIDNVIKVSKETGLKIWSVHLPYGRGWDITEPDAGKRKECVERFRHFVHLSKALKPKKLVLHASFEPIPDGERVQRIFYCQQSINQINEAAKGIKAQLLIEDLPRSCIGNTSDEMTLLLQGVDKSVGICFDTNHLLKENPADFVRKLGSRITSLHVSDYDGIDEKHWYMGKGIIQWKEVITALVHAGYKGVFMFEVGGLKETGKDLTGAALYQSWAEMRDSLRKL